MVGRGGIVVATRQGNSLLVADYADNLRRIRGLIAQIDRDRAGIDAVTLRNSSAREIAATVNSLFGTGRSEEHTSELQSLMRTSYAVFCLKKKNNAPYT